MLEQEILLGLGKKTRVPAPVKSRLESTSFGRIGCQPTATVEQDKPMVKKCPKRRSNETLAGEIPAPSAWLLEYEPGCRGKAHVLAMALAGVIDSPEFGDMTLAEVLGTLELLKARLMAE